MNRVSNKKTTLLVVQISSNVAANITTSIAPFEDPVVQSYYQPLWSKYSSVIVYVNFQSYVMFYDQQTRDYPGGKVLASFKTGDVTGLLLPKQGINAAMALQRQDKLPRIFICSADSSKVSSYGFDYETRAQEIVANH